MSDDRRELLEAALEQAEEGTLEAPIESTSPNTKMKSIVSDEVKASERRNSSSEKRISPVEGQKSGIERRCSIAVRIGFIEKSISERRSEIALL